MTDGYPVQGQPLPTFLDSVFTIADNSDTTKKFQFQASGISTATTRTLTVPDANIVLSGSASALLGSRGGPARAGPPASSGYGLVSSGSAGGTSSIWASSPPPRCACSPWLIANSSSGESTRRCRPAIAK